MCCVNMILSVGLAQLPSPPDIEMINTMNTDTMQTVAKVVAILIPIIQPSAITFREECDGIWIRWAAEGQWGEFITIDGSSSELCMECYKSQSLYTALGEVRGYC